MSFLPSPLFIRVLAFLKISTNSIILKWYFIVSICLSLIIDGDEHVFICLLGPVLIFVASLLPCLFPIDVFPLFYYWLVK